MHNNANHTDTIHSPSLDGVITNRTPPTRPYPSGGVGFITSPIGKTIAQRSARWSIRTVDIEAQGQLLKVKERVYASHQQPPQAGLRDIITTFSQDSRKRMIDQLARIDWEEVKKQKAKPLFITLTYKRNLVDHQRAQRDLDTFAKRLARRCPEMSFVWRKEKQDRGAIHFHLMLFGYRWQRVQTLQSWWAEVSEEPGVNNSLDLKRIKSLNGVMFYVSKYMAKEDAPQPPDAPPPGERLQMSQYSPYARQRRAMGLSIPHISPRQSTGRWWGVRGRKFLPVGKLVKLTYQIPAWLFDAWCEDIPSPFALPQSFTVYSPFAVTFLGHMQHLILDHKKLLDAIHGPRLAGRKAQLKKNVRDYYDRITQYLWAWGHAPAQT